MLITFTIDRTAIYTRSGQPIQQLYRHIVSARIQLDIMTYMVYIGVKVCDAYGCGLEQLADENANQATAAAQLNH